MSSALREVVGAPQDLSVSEWEALHARVVSRQPDLIVELGRGYGNSTVALTGAAHEVGCRVVSVGLDGTFSWERLTVPALLPLVGVEWFAPLTALHLDISETDWDWLPDSRRPFLFWDAHGTEVAGAVISRLLPRLGGALVAVHDVREIGGPDGFAYMWRNLTSPYEELRSLVPVLSEREYTVEDRLLWFELN